jgi:hypothetical protein
MEDRANSSVWLELVGSRPDDYEARAEDLLSRPGFTSAWWGDNQNPDRSDLPRRLPEFATLAIYEVDDRFVAPSLSDSSRGLHFRRTGRPGQGILTGAPTTGVLLVLISPRHLERATALRDWADFVHIRHIAAVAVPGYSMITPYENADGTEPRYLHLYEMDSTDPERTFASMRPLVEESLGPQGSTEFDAWAWHDELRIEYVNTFKRLGVMFPPDH